MSTTLYHVVAADALTFGDLLTRPSKSTCLVSSWPADGLDAVLLDGTFEAFGPAGLGVAKPPRQYVCPVTDDAPAPAAWGPAMTQAAAQSLLEQTSVLAAAHYADETDAKFIVIADSHPGAAAMAGDCLTTHPLWAEHITLAADGVVGGVVYTAGTYLVLAYVGSKTGLAFESEPTRYLDHVQALRAAGAVG